MASSGLATTFGPLLSWMFLPNIATNLLLKFVYSNRILTLPATTEQAELHKKRIRTMVIVSYLLYTIYASIYQRNVNYYELLNVNSDSEVDNIRKSFRKLARIYHPDKMGGGEKNERFFIELRRAHDCLVEPVKRMAYDRFGSIVLNWKDAITVREYYVEGITNSLAFYVVNPVVFGVLHWMNGERIVSYVSISAYPQIDERN
jgi:hypothetical protein